MLVVFNPLDRPVDRTLDVNLYYTGLKEQAVFKDASGAEQTLKLNRNYRVAVPVRSAHGIRVV